MKAILASIMLLLPLIAFAEEREASKVTELDLSAVKLDRVNGGLKDPVVIDDSEALAKLFPSEDAQTAIKKQVDLKTRTLVYFAWSGSGQDKLTPTVTKTDGTEAVEFIFKRGLTKDLRAHHHLFAIPKNAKWSVKHAR